MAIASLLSTSCGPKSGDSLETGTTASSEGESDTSGGSGPMADSSSSGGDESGSVDACGIGDGAAFAWSWTFRDFWPSGMTDAENDGTLLDCVVVAADADADPLSIDLSCTSGGEPVEGLEWSMSPVPAALQQALAAGEELQVRYRPRNDCPNGCMFSGGWLALRRAADGELLLGLVDVHRELGPVAELFASVALAVEPNECPPMVGNDCDDARPWERQGLDVTVTIDGGAVVLGAGEAADLAGYDVVVDVAEVGNVSGCVYDGGDPSRIDVMIARQP